MEFFLYHVHETIEGSMQREWLETNGRGSYASSTTTGQNTRRYHGLLVAALEPPVARKVLLSKLDETIDGRFELGVNEYPDGVLHPRGDLLLRDFHSDPWPTWRYEAGTGIVLEKRLFLVYAEDTVVVEYELIGGGPECQLDVRPLIAFRDFHSLTHENGALDARIDQADPEAVTLKPYADLPPLRFLHNADRVEPSGYWYRRFQYSEERARGLDYEEDLFQPFTLRFRLTAAEQPRAAIIATLNPDRHPRDADQLRERERARRSKFSSTLERAADHFLVKRGAGWTILAGYHWFSDWGRDTMIALPGLTLATRRFDEARQILETFANSVNQGMLPNRFPDAGETPEYNTVDATLWFFEAARRYLEATGDRPFVINQLVPRLREIVDWHIRGTRYQIHVDPADGLLHCGETGVQLTWMDAKVGDWVVTPRRGKPVEIQALWHNALRFLHSQTGDPLYGSMAQRVHDAFLPAFWNPAANCLYDVIDGDRRDPSIRPNQLLAISLPRSLVDPATKAAILDTVRRELLTPFGLRTLAPADPQYRGQYRGGVLERDGAYHQGTVWPWLLGPYLAASGEDVAPYLTAFAPFAGLVPEIFDADAPHEPKGCIAQAWSVAALLDAARKVE